MDWGKACIFAGLAIADVLLLRALLRRCMPDATTPTRVAAGAIGFWATIVGSAFLLSPLGLLQGHWHSLAVTGMLLAIGGMIQYCTPVALGEKSTLLGLAPNDRTASLPHLGSKLARCALLSIGIAYWLNYGVIQLPVDWDSLAYHLPLIDHWNQSGHLWSQDCAFWYVPGNNELIGHFIVSGFSGDYWAQLHNGLPLLILICVSMEWARRLRFSSGATLIAFAAILVNQPVLRQWISAENDLSVMALFAAASLFGWRYVRSDRPTDLIAFALSIGLLAGVKYYAIAYVAAATGLLMLRLLWELRIRQFFVASLAVFSSVGVLGAFWYYRNWRLRGSPLFPKGILGFPDRWSEMRPGFEHSHLVGAETWEVWPLLLKAWCIQAGPLPIVLLWLFIPIVVRRIYSAVRRRRLLAFLSGTDAWLISFGLASLAIYLITPNVVETEYGTLNMLRLQYHPVRFGLCLLFFGALVTTRLVFAPRRASDSLPDNVRGLATWGVGAGALIHGQWHSLSVLNIRSVPAWIDVFFWWPPARERMPWVWISITAVCLGLMLARKSLAMRVPKHSDTLMLVVIGGIFVAVTPLMANRWHRRFDAHFDAVLRTDAVSFWHQQRADDDRLCVFDYRYYPFLGSRRHASVCRPLWMANANELAGYMAKEKTNHVAMPTTPRVAHLRYRRSLDWFRQVAVAYSLEYKDRQFTLFNVASGADRTPILRPGVFDTPPRSSTIRPSTPQVTKR